MKAREEHIFKTEPSAKILIIVRRNQQRLKPARRKRLGGGEDVLTGKCKMLHGGTEGAVDELPGKRVLVLSAIQGDP